MATIMKAADKEHFDQCWGLKDYALLAACLVARISQATCGLALATLERGPCSPLPGPTHPSNCSLILNCEEASSEFQSCFLLLLFPLNALYLNYLSLPTESILTHFLYRRRTRIRRIAKRTRTIRITFIELLLCSEQFKCMILFRYYFYPHFASKKPETYYS